MSRTEAPAVEQPRRLGSAYWRLWSAASISSIGDGVDLVALPLLAASLTRDPRLVAGMATAFTLPWLLFAIPAGAIVDRLDRRKVMYRVDLLRAALVGVIAMTAATGTATIGLLYIVAFLLGSVQTLFDNAAQSILPSVVAPELLETANGREYAAQVIGTSFLGPPLGGLLFSIAVALPFIVDSASFFVAALLVMSLAGSFRPARSPTAVAGERRPPLRRDIAEGIRWLWHHELLLTLALVLGVLNFSAWLGESTMVLFAQEILGLGARGYGLLLASAALGSVLGGLLGARFARALGPGRALVVTIAVCALSAASIGLMSDALAVAALLSVTGFFGIVWNVITVSLRQQIIPDHLLGRVNSVYRWLGWGSIPLGALAGGWIAEAFGLRAPWFVAGTLQLFALVVALPRITTSAIQAAKDAAPVRATPA